MVWYEKNTIIGIDLIRQPNEIAVIGAGIVGLSAAFYLRERGRRVTLIDPDPHGDKASFGNAASFAVSECVPAGLPGLWKKIPKWLLDPCGPLFIRPSYAPRLLSWFHAFHRASSPIAVAHISQNLSRLNALCLHAAEPIFAAVTYADHVHHCGALTLYADETSFEQDRVSWDIRERLGIRFRRVKSEELWSQEPALSRAKSFAIETQHWSHIDDPKDLHQRMLDHLIKRGIKVVKARVTKLTPNMGGPIECQLDTGATATFERIIIAAGAYSADLAHQVGDRVLLTSERGYNATLPNAGFEISKPLIFAEEKIVATPVANGLRIGGAAEFAGLSARPNYERSTALVRAVSPAFKTLNTTGMAKWMGHRPATPDSLPVIGRSPRHSGVFYAFGHGHLGLTQGPLTGRLICDLMLGVVPQIDLGAFAIERFSGR